MQPYYPRFAEKKILQLASYFPAVAIVGPRQVGKTSLVQAIRNQLDSPSVYLDLESPDDLIRLDNPSLFLNPLADHTVILDEVQKLPSLFPQLRGIIDRERHPGRFTKIKYSTTPKLSRGFYIAQSDLKTQKHFVICPVEKGFPLSEEVRVLGYRELETIFDE